MNKFTQSILDWKFIPKHCFLENLFNIAWDFAGRDFEIPKWRGATFPEADDNIFIEFLGVVSAIDFCFTDRTGKKFDVEYPKGEIQHGTYALGASIKRAIDEGVPVLDLSFLSTLTEENAAIIFRPVTTPITMLSERTYNLRNVGYVLENSGIGSFSNLLKESNFCAFNNGDGVVEKLVKLFSCFKDACLWVDGGISHVLHFQKRAQLFAMKYFGRAHSSMTLEPLKDPQNIGPIADYDVPKALRALGAIKYGPELAETVDRRVEVPSESLMELEIRARTVCAMHDLLMYINKFGTKSVRKGPIIMAELDFAVRSAGRTNPSPHHYTFTSAY